MVLFNHSVRPSKKTQFTSITNTSWLVLFREIIAVYAENCKIPMDAFHGQNVELLNVKADGTYNYHWALTD
jgi:hypothetical protein